MKFHEILTKTEWDISKFYIGILQETPFFHDLLSI